MSRTEDTAPTEDISGRPRTNMETVPRSDITPAFALRSTLDALLNNKAELQQLVRTYFGTVHCEWPNHDQSERYRDELRLKHVISDYGFLTFVHEPSFMRLLDQGKAPRQLTAMMVACTLR